MVCIAVNEGPPLQEDAFGCTLVTDEGWMPQYIRSAGGASIGMSARSHASVFTAMNTCAQIVFVLGNGYTSCFVSLRATDTAAHIAHVCFHLIASGGFSVHSLLFSRPSCRSPLQQAGWRRSRSSLVGAP